MAEKEVLGCIAEHGVVRKRSIRRKLSRIETIKEIQYGIYPDEYEKICERVASEKHFRNSVEALQERWRMIMFMYEDCVDLVKEFENNHVQRRKDRKKQLLYLYLLLGSVFIGPVVVLLLALCWQIC